ncbi:MAG: cobalamin biosynthesis protein [Rhodobacteraceae bacterium]|nr:cobalamin biosynthesis protein [Paracoccaceae bacterium]
MSAPILAAALALDAMFGEPEALWSRLPHPAVLMGRAVDWADRRFNRGARRQTRGLAVMAGFALAALALGEVITALPLGWLVETVLTAILLAQRSLVQHVAAVAAGLWHSVADGRAAVARIVSRDTAAMDGPAIARSAIESAAENLSDGVVAPAFWYLVLGLPGLLLYKITNTADSMIGYRTPRHEAFGWAAARLDDVLNWIPARLTALLIALPHGVLRDWPAIARDARRHRSPNAGWPEAAMARALDIALAGPRSYDGRLTDFPWVHPEGNRNPGPERIDAAVAVLWRAWRLIFAGVIVLALV